MQNSKKRILIYGAGAIGRGYVPWLFNSDEFELSFVEQNDGLRTALNQNKKYSTYRTKDSTYEELICKFDHCYDSGEVNPKNFDFIITAVGPRQVFTLIDTFKDIDCPIIMFENDSSIPPKFRSITGKENFYFGIPDVITSNTAPDELLKKDSLNIITEDGVCFAESGAKEMGGNIEYVSPKEIDIQWAAKLYIHNTPHCIAAYLGALQGRNFLHEGMTDNVIYKIVEGAMMEMNKTIVSLFDIDKAFSDWYSDKELSRFSNTLLCDPISRVAREPFRKLGLEDRLIGAAQLALSAGVIPKFLIMGIIAAFLYDDKNDEDHHISILLNSLTKEQFLNLIVPIQPHEALYKIMVKFWDESINVLEKIKING